MKALPWQPLVTWVWYLGGDIVDFGVAGFPAAACLGKRVGALLTIDGMHSEAVFLRSMVMKAFL
jgi:hypothetical protein